MVQQVKRKDIKVFFLATGLLCSVFAKAQVLQHDIAPGSYLNLLEEQFAEGHYTMAAQTARQYLDAGNANNVTTEQAINIDKAHYLLALSCLKTNVPGARDSTIKAMNATLNPVYRERLGFALAQYYFRNNDLAKAIPLYEKTGAGNLSESELAEEKFELAYCYFNNKQFDKAEPLFVAIKELKDNKYYLAGNYYYGLLVYNKNKYHEALQSFDRIKDDREYRQVVPYYIAEIHYFMGNREKALLLADTLIRRKERSFYDKELHLLEAQCLFEEQRYKEALPYFDFFYSHADKIRKQDLYEIAYCYYRTEAWKEATEKFKLLSNASDSLGQTAMYLLGDCYLKTGDKPGARNAFGICADMTFNPGQQEASMIMFARLSYETGFDDDALRQLKAMIVAFPMTQFKDEANTLISELLVKTNKFEEALKHLKAVSRKDATYKLVYQRANYGYAVDEFRKGELTAALGYFDHSMEHAANPDYEIAACFWKGEVAYRLKHYNDVITFEQQFIGRKGNRAAIARISPLATVQHAYLNMGYAAMALENYQDAQNYFNLAQEENADDAFSGQIAAVRHADAVFMQKNYQKAITLYDKIAANDSGNADYARYQKAILLGLLGKHTEKIALLQSIIKGQAHSDYANHARYEIAVTYLESDKYKLALTYLNQLTDSIADKSFAPQSWMKKGFVYQQLGDHDMAISAYKHVVIEYPAAEDRFAALEALKSIYIQSNRPAEYSRLLKENNLPSAESSSIDSAYYSAAETQFSNGNWQEALTGFDNYLQEYPNGIFAIKAHYYRGESYFQLKKYREAGNDYKEILGGSVNEYFENSARRAASIAYDSKDFKSAYDYYLLLRNNSSTEATRQISYIGLMKSGYNTGKYRETGLYADTVLAIHGVSVETANEALFFKARSLQQTDSTTAAIELYTLLSHNKSGEVAAESRYHISELLYKQDSLKDAETAANETIHLSAGYDFWIVKSYLLLSDILVKQKDYFNAKATLQSIAKHTKIEELKKEAGQKLDEVNKLEKAHSKLSEEQ